MTPQFIAEKCKELLLFFLSRTEEQEKNFFI
jgi:hypothetical protein